MKDNKQNLKERYDKLISLKNQYKALWDRIAKYVGIGVNTNYSENTSTAGTQLDSYINDPTASLSVQQSGDYMLGIMWGTGENAIVLEPSDSLLELVDEDSVSDWFRWITDRTLFHINHPQSGTNSALKSHNYDQFSFGTSGIGAFINEEFKRGKAENALIMRAYGIDTIAIDEGKNGMVEVVFVTYNWRVNRIINEFCLNSVGDIDPKKVKSLPDDIQNDFNQGNYNKEHKIIHAVYPRDDFNPRARGKKGAKYVGEWFSYKSKGEVFYREDYKQMPIAIARAIKIRGEVYGRASGTMILGTIASVNYIIGETSQILEKMEDPALGTWNSALWGDSVLDSSAGAITVFNQELLGGAKNPLFPIHDIGDPTGIINFLIPYFNEKITTAFKVDVLLDFNDSTQRTATEMMQRAIIRGKNLAGMLQQQKIELYDRWIDRCVSLLYQLGVYGVDPHTLPEKAYELKRVGKTERIIPDAVLELERKGIKWYKIRYNGELDRLTKTEALEKIITMLNAVGAIAGMYPQIIEAINWYDLFVDVNKYLGINYFKNEKEFKAIIEQQAQAQQLAMASQVQNTGANTQKLLSEAEKNKESVNNGY